MNNETLPDELRARSDDQVTTNAAKAIERLLARVSALRGTVQAQASVIANYKQLATTAIDDAVALRAQLAAPAPSTAGEQDWLLKSTQDLAKAIARDNYPDVPQFEVRENLAGVISQIDNMTCGMVRAHGITGEPK